ncbi:MAG: glycosyltransferase [Alphaproteobacteria bacterium]|nr:glycosyltransferase [Alphaproteobacteria bacterium]
MDPLWLERVASHQMTLSPRPGGGTQKILHVITGLGSGGAERQLTALVRGSGAASLRHVVVSLMDEGIYGAELRAAGVEVHSLGIGRGRASLGAFFRLVRLIRHHRPQVVQTWLYHADLAGLLAAVLGGRPKVIWTLRCSDMQLDRYAPLTRSIVRVLAHLSRLPAAVIANSAAGLRVHERLGYRPRHTRVIPNGIDTGAFHPDPEARAAVRSEFGISAEVPLIGCLARHDPMKDHAGLLTAFAKCGDSARLLLAGTGTEPDNKSLTNEIFAAGLDPSRVIRLGERRDVPRLLAALDLFVLSSAFGEGFPNVVAEAMSCGIPGVVTDVGDAAAILGPCGTVAPPSDPAAMTTAIKKLLALSPDDRTALGLQARHRITARYGLTSMTEAYEALYTDLILTARDTANKIIRYD